MAALAVDVGAKRDAPVVAGVPDGAPNPPNPNDKVGAVVAGAETGGTVAALEVAVGAAVLVTVDAPKENPKSNHIFFKLRIYTIHNFN